MDNSSYRSQYIQSGNENFSEQSVSVYDAFWKRLEKAERSIGKSLEDGYTTEEYAILIGKMNVSNLNAFATYKSRVNRYIKWLNERGLIDQPYLDSQSNGLVYMIDRMKDQKLFAHVNLVKGERSELSELASNLM